MIYNVGNQHVCWKPHTLSPTFLSSDSPNFLLSSHFFLFFLPAPYTSVSQCVKATLASNGFRGPFQGFGPTLVRNAPANGIYLGSFEVMKQRAATHLGCDPKDVPAAVVLGAGGLGGTFYWLAIFPVDVVKSAMMTDAIEPAKRQYPNMLATTKKLWAEGGVSRFYRGFSPCLMRAIPANGTMLLTVTKMHDLMADL
jgi:solute carrier family 25 (mitochondrial carnitine/acylcarnitine transporter), member 20/29